MTTFIEFLEEISENRQMIVLPGAEVERLAERFGSTVRSIGFWNSTGDGSVEVPMSNITDAAKTLGIRTITEAVAQLRNSGELSQILHSSSAAVQLLNALHNLYLRQFHERVERYQNSKDPGDAERLRREISRDLFGA